MNFLLDKRKRKIFIITTSVVLALVVIVGACAIYLGDYYRADSEAIDAFLPEGETWNEESDRIAFEPEGATKGLIFYPGDFTEYIIDGGCHAYFGMYGAQDGDGTPKLTSPHGWHRNS